MTFQLSSKVEVVRIIQIIYEKVQTTTFLK